MNRLKQILKPILSAFLIGLLVGFILYGFKWITAFASKWNLLWISYMKTSWFFIVIVVLALFLIAIILDKILYEEPNAGGSSISRVSKLIEYKTPIQPAKSTIFTILSTFFVFLTGTPLGIEGPSIMIGTSLGAIHSKNRSEDDQTQLRAAGASAGFSAITGSPLSSIFFVMEEIMKKPTWKTIRLALFGAFGAFLVLIGFDGLFNTQSTTFFHFEYLTKVPSHLFWIFIIIGFFGFISAYMFNRQVTFFNRFFAIYLYRMTRKARFFFTLLAIIGVGYFYTDLIGSGHDSILSNLFHHEYTIGYIGLLLLLKIFFIALANASDLPGGMFVPVLVVGGLYGALFNEFFIYMGLDAMYTSTIIYIFMGTFFATSMKAPITAIVFFTEASYFNPQSLYIWISIGVVFGLSKLVHYESINDLVIDTNKAQKMYNNVYQQVRLKINANSKIIGMTVKELFQGDNLIVKGIVHIHEPNYTDLAFENWRIIGGDEIVILSNIKPNILKKKMNQYMDDCELEIV